MKTSTKDTNMQFTSIKSILSCHAKSYIDIRFRFSNLKDMPEVLHNALCLSIFC